jgi:hypothetical protein
LPSAAGHDLCHDRLVGRIAVSPITEPENPT